jgi:1D-myo-inositol-tetrakisphosphate 5-kinase/inositol-polyphosphate multikinase
MMMTTRVAEGVDPARLKELIFRVAGHKTIRQDDSRFLKFIYEDRYNAWWETRFFENIAPKLPGLHPLLPKYHGIATVEGTDGVAKYLALEHFTLNYKNAVVLDMKIGTQSYDYDANADKIKKEIAKFDKQEELAIRVSGARMWCRKQSELVYLIQEDLAHVTPDTFQDEIIGRFLFDGKSYRKKTGILLHKKLEQLRRWFEEENDQYRFFGSSVLMLYDADAPDGDRCDFYFIDHAHVQEFRNGETKDTGVIKGITNIMNAIDDICLDKPPKGLNH